MFISDMITALTSWPAFCRSWLRASAAALGPAVAVDVVESVALASVAAGFEELSPPLLVGRDGLDASIEVALADSAEAPPEDEPSDEEPLSAVIVGDASAVEELPGASVDAAGSVEPVLAGSAAVAVAEFKPPVLAPSEVPVSAGVAAESVAVGPDELSVGAVAPEESAELGRPQIPFPPSLGEAVADALAELFGDVPVGMELTEPSDDDVAVAEAFGDPSEDPEVTVALVEASEVAVGLPSTDEADAVAAESVALELLPPALSIGREEGLSVDELDAASVGAPLSPTVGVAVKVAVMSAKSCEAEGIIVEGRLVIICSIKLSAACKPPTLANAS